MGSRRGVYIHGNLPQLVPTVKVRVSHRIVGVQRMLKATQLSVDKAKERLAQQRDPFVRGPLRESQSGAASTVP